MSEAASQDRRNLYGSVRSVRSVADVTRANVQAMRELEQLSSERLSASDRVADIVARACGHIGFIIAHLVAFGAWIVWNSVAETKIDPFPFTLLTLWASAESIFLMSFVLISQNYQARLSERRNQMDLQINLLAEQENSKMLLLLEDIAKKVGALEHDDQEVGVLVQATRPETLAQQIDEAYREDEGGDGKRRPASA